RRKSSRWALLVAWVGSLILPVIVIGARYENPVLELFNRTVSPVVTGPHLVGARVEWDDPDSWHDWTQVMEDYQIISVHVALSPPGLPMWYGFIKQLMEWNPALANRLYIALLPN